MKPLAKLLDAPDGAAAGIGDWLTDPGRFRTMVCTECGAELWIPRSKPDTTCVDCQRKSFANPLRRAVDLGDRVAALTQSGCPRRYAETAFIEPSRGWPSDVRKPEDSVAAWEGKPWCVTFLGVVESGKTMFATELFWRRMHFSRRAVWTTAADIVHAIYGDLGGEESDSSWRRYALADLLLVDDLGRGHSGITWDTLTDVLAYRFDHLLPTLVTSNRRSRGEVDAKNRHAGLQDEQPQLYRRLLDGLVVGLTERRERS